MGIALRLSHSRIGDVTRLSFTVLVVIHVLISAWLVVDFEGRYTEGKPSPTNVNALIAVDNEKTLIDVEMENSTSFILYMLFRDYSEPEVESNQTENQSDDSSKSKDSSDDESKEWLKLGRNMVFITMVLLIISEILVIIGIPFRATLRALIWVSLVASFAIVIPSTYVLDLVGDDEESDEDSEEDSVTDSLSQETFVQSTESGSMAHEDSSIDSNLIFWGVQFNMMFSGYDLGLVEPENYTAIRAQPPEENSSDADSFVKFESNLKLKYGKNLPSLMLIPLAWFLLPAKPKNQSKQYLFESE